MYSIRVKASTATRSAVLVVLLYIFSSWPPNRFLVAGAWNNSYNDTDCGPANELQTYESETFPWGVGIRFHPKRGPSVLACLGTILDPYTVLTDFRDVFKSRDSENLRIYPPESYEVFTLNEKFNTTVSHITIHPNYSWPNPMDWANARNDFALFHLENPIPFNSASKPVCLPENEEDVQDLTEPGKRLLSVGINRQYGYSNLKSLIFNVNEQNECSVQWTIHKNETGTAPYVERACANPITGQHNTMICIQRSTGLYSVHNITKSIKLVGFTNEFFSYKPSITERICNENAVYFFNIFTNQTINWIKNSLDCEPDEILCGMSTQCVPKHSLCNKTPECDNGWDENVKLCNAMKFCETDSDFRCSTYEGCVPKDQVCNGIKNCPGGQDEDEEMCKMLRTWQLVLIIILSVAGVVLFLSAIIILWKKWKAAKRFKLGLTNQEIKYFFEGDSSLSNDFDCSSEYPTDKQPYDKRFECNLDEQLSVDWKKVLGEGELGTVYRGWIQSVSEGEDVPMKTEVAVKTFRKGASPSHFTALLSELKILTYIGSHENVVSLHGACTEDIQKRVIFIAVEFCARGSLEKYLRENRERFQEDSGLRKVVVDETRVKDGYIQPRYVKMGDFEFMPSDLLVWALQIAKGMNYVSSLRVIHGDLAARNVLLDASGNAKICDFGLARKLYSNKNYVRDHNSDTLIPLWWTAPESLQDEQFSSKSDVWSFGVTLWEIFSLGHIPNYGLSDIQLLLNKLKSNERLPKPEHSSNLIYGIMRKCWEWKASERPEFSTLQDTLTSLIVREVREPPAENLTDSGISLNECV